MYLCFDILLLAVGSFAMEVLLNSLASRRPAPESDSRPHFLQKCLPHTGIGATKFRTHSVKVEQLSDLSEVLAVFSMELVFVTCCNYSWKSNCNKLIGVFSPFISFRHECRSCAREVKGHLSQLLGHAQGHAQSLG